MQPEHGWVVRARRRDEVKTCLPYIRGDQVGYNKQAQQLHTFVPPGSSIIFLTCDHLSAVMDDHLSPACGAHPVIHRKRRDRLNGCHPREHLPEDDMMAIKVRSRARRDIELRAVGVWPCVHHAKQPRLRVRRDESFVRKVRAIDRLATRAVPADKVAPLYAQAGDDAVDRAPFIMHRRPRERMHALVATDELPKVLGRPREPIRPKLEHDALGRGLAANTKADPHLRVWLGLVWVWFGFGFGFGFGLGLVWFGLGLGLGLVWACLGLGVSHTCGFGLGAWASPAGDA